MPGEAEDMVDDYLDEADGLANAAIAPAAAPASESGRAERIHAGRFRNRNSCSSLRKLRVYDPVAERARYSAFRELVRRRDDFCSFGRIPYGQRSAGGRA